MGAHKIRLIRSIRGSEFLSLEKGGHLYVLVRSFSNPDGFAAIFVAAYEVGVLPGAAEKRRPEIRCEVCNAVLYT
jgi:hypothetical protein